MPLPRKSDTGSLLFLFAQGCSRPLLRMTQSCLFTALGTRPAQSRDLSQVRAKPEEERNVS